MLSNILNASTNIKKYSANNRLITEAVSYIGRPKQSISEPDKLFLNIDPLSGHGAVLEFKTNDILFAETIETVSNHDGSTFQIFKVWIKRAVLVLNLNILPCKWSNLILRVNLIL